MRRGKMAKELFPAEVRIRARRVVERCTVGEDRELLLEALDLDWKGAQPPKQMRIGELGRITDNGEGFYSDKGHTVRNTWNN